MPLMKDQYGTAGKVQPCEKCGKTRQTWKQESGKWLCEICDTAQYGGRMEEQKMSEQALYRVPNVPDGPTPKAPKLSLRVRAALLVERALRALGLRKPVAPEGDDAQRVLAAVRRARLVTMNPTMAATSRGRLAYSLALDVLAMSARHQAAVELLEQAMPALIAARDVDERPDANNLGKLKKALNG